MTFELLTSCRVKYPPVTVKKWRSSRTGFELTWIDQPSPFINAIICTRVMIEDDTGWLHAFDRLVAKHDEESRYSFSRPCFRRFTKDSYRYFLSAVGWESFKILLPLRLSYLLHPDFNANDFHQKVHAVDINGRDSGEVYNEIRAAERQPEALAELAAGRVLYQKTGYSYSDWGLSRDIAKLKLNTLRDQHRKFFQPENMAAVVIGSVSEVELLELMTAYDDNLPVKQAPLQVFRPRTHDVPLKKTQLQKVEFPSESNTSQTLVTLTWIGPDGRDYVMSEAAEILAQYLSQEFGYQCQLTVRKYQRTGLCFRFWCGAGEEEQLISEFVKYIQRMDIDRTKLRHIIRTRRRAFIFQSERNKYPYNKPCIVQSALHEVSFGAADGSDLKAWLRTLDRCNMLLTWHTLDWVSAFKQVFLFSRPCIVVTKPSHRLLMKEKWSEGMLKASRKRRSISRLIHMFKPSRGKDGASPPVGQQYVMPTPGHINFLHITSIGVGLDAETKNNLTSDVVKILNDTPKNFPMYVHVENVRSYFANISMFVSVFELPEKYLPYVPVLMKVLDLDPVGGDSLTHDISYCCHEFIQIDVTIPGKSYKRVVDWFYSFLFETKLSHEKVTTALRAITAEEWSTREELIRNKILLAPRSLVRVCDETDGFCQDLLGQIEDGDFDEVYRMLEETRNEIFQLRNMRVVLSLDCSRTTEPVSPWRVFVQNQNQKKMQEPPLLEFPSIHKKVLQLEGDKLAQHGKCIITGEGEESISVFAYNPVPLEAFEWILALECFNVADVISTTQDMDNGLLALNVNCDDDMEKSYKAVKQTVSNLATGTMLVDERLQLQVIARLVLEEAAKQENYPDTACAKAYDTVLTERGAYYGERMLKAFSALNNQDLVAVFDEYYKKLFDPATSVCVVSCLEKEKAGVGEFFKGLGYSVEYD